MQLPATSELTTSEIEGVKVQPGATSDIIARMKKEDASLHTPPQGLNAEGHRIRTFIEQTARHLTSRMKHAGITYVTTEAVGGYMDALCKPPEEGGYGSLKAAADAYHAMPKANGGGNGHACTTPGRLFVEMVLAGKVMARMEHLPSAALATSATVPAATAALT